MSPVSYGARDRLSYLGVQHTGSSLAQKEALLVTQVSCLGPNKEYYQRSLPAESGSESCPSDVASQGLTQRVEVLQHLMARMRLTKATGLEVEKRDGHSPPISSPDERPRPEKGCGSRRRGLGLARRPPLLRAGVWSCYLPPPTSGCVQTLLGTCSGAQSPLYDPVYAEKPQLLTHIQKEWPGGILF